LYCGVLQPRRKLGTVPDDRDDGLDGLSSKELHELAVSFAKRHRDARFFLHLSETLPAAEAVAGEYERAAAEVIEPGAHIGDVTDSGSGATAEAMRPFYLDYLRGHGIEAPESPA
jgi:hypothetical protein